MRIALLPLLLLLLLLPTAALAPPPTLLMQPSFLQLLTPLARPRLVPVFPTTRVRMLMPLLFQLRMTRRMTMMTMMMLLTQRLPAVLPHQMVWCSASWRVLAHVQQHHPQLQRVRPP